MVADRHRGKRYSSGLFDLFHPQILREIRINKADGDDPEQRFAMLV
jgi:hypothetical protein